MENNNLNREASPASGRIQRLQAEIEDLKKRMPAHSVPPSMFQRLEELEEELENELHKGQS